VCPELVERPVGYVVEALVAGETEARDLLVSVYSSTEM